MNTWISTCRKPCRKLPFIAVIFGMTLVLEANAQQELVDFGDMETFEFFAPYPGTGLTDSGGVSYDTIGFDKPLGGHWFLFGFGPDNPQQDDIGSADDPGDAFEFDFTNGYCPECTLSQETNSSLVGSGSASGKLFSPSTDSLLNHSFFGNGFSYPGLTFNLANSDVIQPGHQLDYSVELRDDRDFSFGSTSGGLDIELRFDVIGVDSTGAEVRQRLGVSQLVSSDISNNAYSTFSTSLTVPATVTDDNNGAVSVGSPTQINAVLFFFGTNGAPSYSLYFDEFSIVNQNISAGDFNGNGTVDGSDFLYWQRGFSPRPLSQSDLTDWQDEYGLPVVAASSVSSVPEPTTAVIVLAMLGLMTCKRVRS